MGDADSASSIFELLSFLLTEYRRIRADAGDCAIVPPDKHDLWLDPEVTDFRQFVTFSSPTT